MFKLKKNGLKALKIFHLLAVSCWVGGAVSMILLNIYNSHAVSEGMLYGINTASHLIDFWIILIFGVSGCLITGVIYGVFTTWGFCKHKWIIVKWIIVFAALISATVFLGPAVESMLELSRSLGTNALYSDMYLKVKSSHLQWSLLQIAMYIGLIILSVIKPWGKRGNK